MLIFAGCLTFMVGNRTSNADRLTGNHKIHRMRFAVIGDFQFVDHTVYHIIRHGMFAVTVLRQQLRVRHFNLNQVYPRAVVGEHRQPLAAQVAVEVGGVEDK